MAFDVGSAVAKLKLDLKDFKDGISDAKGSVGGLTGTIGGAMDGLADFGKKAAIFTGVLAGGLALAGKAGIESAAKFEQYQIAFTTLLKDQVKAAEAIKNIQTDAAKTPFELAPLVMANQRLISAGVSAEKARKDILNLGDAISATGGGGAELERLSTNLQQIKAVGKATALDIKQFAFAGINVYQLLADATGKNVEQVKDMDVSYEVLADAFEKASGKGGMFENAMLKQSRSLNGLLSTLRDTVSLGMKDILMNSGLFELIRSSVERLIPLLESLVPKIVAFFAALPNDPTFVAILTMLTDAFTVFGKWIAENQELVITFLKGLAVGIGALVVIGTITMLVTALLNPLTLLVLGVAAVYTAWQTNFLGIRDITQQFIDWINAVFMPAFNVVVAWFTERWDTISLIVKGAWAIITGVIHAAWVVISAIITVGLDLLSGNWKHALETIIGAQEAFKNDIQKILQGIVDFLLGWGGTVFHGLVKPFEDAWNKVKELAEKIKGAVDPNVRHSPSLVDRVQKGVRDLNAAWSNLDMVPTGMTQQFVMPSSAGAGVGASVGGGTTILQISLDGAIIADDLSAQRISERIGDSIIRKLQANIRF